MTNEKNSYAISVLLENKPGVLNRVILVFSRRGWNIESLSVSNDPCSEFSRCSIVVSGERNTLNIILSQLKKLVNVANTSYSLSDDVSVS